MIDLEVRDRQGNVVETVQFDESLLGTRINYPLMHAAIVMFEANRRRGTAKTKALREIAGSRHKPYRQKGTGRARMGHRRRVGSRGGQTCHGPKPRDYSHSMPRKARKLALKSALLGKFLDGEVIVVDDLSQEKPKTHEIAHALKNLKIEKGCLVVSSQNDETLWKSVRNIPDTDLSPLSDLNTYNVLRRKHLLLTKAALEALTEEFK